MRFLLAFVVLATAATCKSQPPTRPVSKGSSGAIQDTNDSTGTKPIAKPDGTGSTPPQQTGSTPPDTTDPLPDESVKDIPVVTPPDIGPKVPLVLENGVYTIQNMASHKCLEVTSASNDTPIVQFGCNGTGIQAFKIEKLGESEYKVINIETKKALDVKDLSKDDGVGLQQFDYNNGLNQAFVIARDGTIPGAATIVAKHSMKFIQIPDSSLKSKVQPTQASENKKDNQRWIFTKITEPKSADGVRYTFVNECDHDVWVGSQPNPGFPTVKGDFKLAPGGYNQTDTAANWEGRFWGRYNCRQEGGKLICDSGSCDNKEICGTSHGIPPVSIAEFKTKGYMGIDFYDISLVDGSNLPMDIRPMPLTLKADGAAGSCKHLECKPDIRADCPAELQQKNGAGKVIGCKSACEAFHTDAYCCLGAFAKDKCQPSNYAKFFDNKCPDAYSFAEDVKTFTCRNADYEVIFCPK